jgi:anti-sigma B factor antagonist
MCSGTPAAITIALKASRTWVLSWPAAGKVDETGERDNLPGTSNVWVHEKGLYTDGGGVMVVSSTSADLVKVGSHLDVRNVGHVRTVLHAVIASAHGDIIVDLAELDIIDAAGLGMLTAAHLRAERAGRRLVLRHCSDDVRRVLAVTHLNRILHIDRLSLTA